MIHLRLDVGSAVPRYMQLVQQVRYAVRNGTLRPGMQLPPAREVVASLAINPNTVFKAYAQLEREGLVVSRPGLGTFVAKTAPQPIEGPTHRKLARSLRAWLSTASQAGIERDAAIAMFSHCLDTVYAEEIA